MSRAFVIGAGLAGLTTAFELLGRGWAVTVLDSQTEVAQGASHANGSLLTPSMSQPWNAPGIHRHLAVSLFRPDSPLKLWPSAVPALIGWGTRFLLNSSATRSRAAAEANFRLAFYSMLCLEELQTQLALRDETSGPGLLRIFRDGAVMQAAMRSLVHLQQVGLRLEALDAAQAVERERSLAEIRGRIAGAIFYPDDRCGDAYAFCRAVKAAFTQAGGELRLGTAVRGVDVEAGRVTGIRLHRERLSATTVVLAAGVHSPTLARGIGVQLPIAPAKGYTVTIQLPGGTMAPRIPVVDDALHAGVVPVSGGLRLAGTAEFAGYDSTLEPQRIAQLIRVLEGIYPRIGAGLDPSRAQSWTGLRPVSADGVPLIGGTRVKGLFVNSGHGPLGWTMAAGSARLLADEMCGAHPALDARPYRVNR